MRFRVPKTTSDTPNSTSTDAARRRTTNAVKPPRSAQASPVGLRLSGYDHRLRREPDVIKRVCPGVRVHEAADLLVERFGLQRVQHVDPGNVVVEQFLNLLVDLRRRRRV